MTKTPLTFLLLLPAPLEVVDPVETSPMWSYVSACAAHAQRLRVEARRVDAGLREERVRRDTQLFDDVVLEQPMDDDHVRADELLAAGHRLVDRRAVVDDELEVEVGDADARVALAGRRLAHVAAAASETEVAALDRVEQHRPVDAARPA